MPDRPAGQPCPVYTVNFLGEQGASQTEVTRCWCWPLTPLIKQWQGEPPVAQPGGIASLLRFTWRGFPPASACSRYQSPGLFCRLILGPFPVLSCPSSDIRIRITSVCSSFPSRPLGVWDKPDVCPLVCMLITAQVQIRCGFLLFTLARPTQGFVVSLHTCPAADIPIPARLSVVTGTLGHELLNLMLETPRSSRQMEIPVGFQARRPGQWGSEVVVHKGHGQGFPGSPFLSSCFLSAGRCLPEIQIRKRPHELMAAAVSSSSC